LLPVFFGGKIGGKRFVVGGKNIKIPIELNK